MYSSFLILWKSFSSFPTKSLAMLSAVENWKTEQHQEGRPMMKQKLKIVSYEKPYLICKKENRPANKFRKQPRCRYCHQIHFPVVKRNVSELISMIFPWRSIHAMEKTNLLLIKSSDLKLLIIWFQTRTNFWSNTSLLDTWAKISSMIRKGENNTP